MREQLDKLVQEMLDKGILYDDARREFEKAEGLYTGLPWDYLGGLDAYEGAMKAIWKRGAPPRPAGS